MASHTLNSGRVGQQGHDFSRADQVAVSFVESGLQPARACCSTLRLTLCTKRRRKLQIAVLTIRRRSSSRLRQIAFLLLFFTWATLSQTRLAGAQPVRRLIDATSSQDQLFAQAFQETQNWVGKAFPGAVLAIAQHGRLLAWKAFGRMDSSENARPMPYDAIFDLASLSKVIGTTTAAEILYERHQVDLDAPVTEYIPEFAGTPGHEKILVRHLLTHSSGLNSKEVLWRQASDRAGIMKLTYTLPVQWEPGTRTQYRDYNMILFGEIVQRITGQRLDQFLKHDVFGPLGMKDTSYDPPPKLLARIPPTEQDDILRHTLVHGVVHDENAFLMGGVSGHAGLFSSAHDLSIFAQMYLNGGTYNGKRIISQQTLEMFVQRQSSPPGTTRALGWDTPGGPNSFASELASPHAIIHTGFTGTSIYIDSDRDAFVVLLTNRVNPTRRNVFIDQARPAIHTAILRTLDATQTGTSRSTQVAGEPRFSAAVDAASDSVPIYEVLRTAEPIRVDGNLDKRAWLVAPVAGPLVNNTDGSPSPIRTEVRILYDDTFIYFAFRNTDENIWATMTQRDQHLWEEEVDEVFVQRDPQRPNYIELEINPRGAIFDAYFSDVRKPVDAANWNSKNLRWAVHVDGTVDGQPGDKQWTCEIALPLEDLRPAPHRPPQPGDRWRVNFYRIERVPVQARLAWSGRHRDFHVPAMFGEIVFSSRVAGS